MCVCVCVCVCMCVRVCVGMYTGRVRGMLTRVSCGVRRCSNVAVRDEWVVKEKDVEVEARERNKKHKEELLKDIAAREALRSAVRAARAWGTGARHGSPHSHARLRVRISPPRARSSASHCLTRALRRPGRSTSRAGTWRSRRRASSSRT